MSEGGRVTNRVTDADGNERREHAGRWIADAECRTVTIVMDKDDHEPATAQIEDDRLVFERRPGRVTGLFSGVAFDRVR